MGNVRVSSLSSILIEFQCRANTYVWLLLGYPVLAAVHALACVISWLLVFTIPVSKMNTRTLAIILLMAPEDVHVHALEKVKREIPRSSRTSRYDVFFSRRVKFPIIAYKMVRCFFSRRGKFPIIAYKLIRWFFSRRGKFLIIAYKLTRCFFFFFATMFFFQTHRCESRVILCCYRAVNVYYYKYTVQGINIFALSILLGRVLLKCS